jgi:hypothetical protein
MSMAKTLLIIGIMLRIAPVLFGHPWWFFGVKMLVRLAAATWILAGAA